MDLLDEIKNSLRNKSQPKAKESWKKFLGESEKVYGVYVADINKMVAKYVSGGFELVEKLWNADYLEEKLLAAKILGRISRKNPELTLTLVDRFADSITNWAVCDTLATQSLRPISKQKQSEIIQLAKKSIKSENLWKKRFGVVLLINFKNEPSLRHEIKQILKEVEGDNEYYVRKAVEWAKRSLK